MWKENKYSELAVKESNIKGYSYLRDRDTCNFCKEHENESPYPKIYCNTFSCCNSSSFDEDKILSIEKSKDLTNIYLYSIIPGRNDSGELEQIIFSLSNNLSKDWVIRKNFIHAQYDPFIEMKPSYSKLKEFLENIPLYQESTFFPPTDFLKIKDFDINLNSFDGSKKEWIVEYQNNFEDVKEVLEKLGETISTDSDLLI